MAYTYQQAIAWLQEHNFPHVDYQGKHPDETSARKWHIFAIDTMAVPDDFMEKAKVTQAQEMDLAGDVVMYRLEYRKGRGDSLHIVDPAYISFVAAIEDEPLVMNLDDEEDVATGAQMSGQGATTIFPENPQ